MADCNNENKTLVNDLYQMDLKEYQNYIKERLISLYPDTEIITEWNAMKDERELDFYSPRIDAAIGPFATNGRYEDVYDQMVENPKWGALINRLLNFNNDNLAGYNQFTRPPDYHEIVYQNSNARCFMGIEIENKVSRKHLLGGAINASALSRIGIVIPWSDDKLRAFIRLVRYFQYLKLAEKNTFNTTNLLIITKEQFLSALNYPPLIRPHGLD
ncbi:hypothetical protein V1503_24150 [Bacillus sp. SCS-151]|uniref:hypothetical protein n=1 Tax=Nanhaiella sioensis TaxID=3115293 RepID=UPI00397B1413